MKALNIPLSGTTHTTRRSRWVVWRFLALVFVLILLWSLAHLRATQNPFQAFTPEETRFVIHLRPTQTSWDRLLPALQKEALISGITLGELAPFLHGSLVLFLTSRGERVVGIEGDLPTETQKTLVNYGVRIEPVGTHRFLLSTKPVQTYPMEHTVGKLQRLFPSFAGSIIDLENGAPYTIIRRRGANVILDTPERIDNAFPVFVNEHAIFAGPFSSQNTNTVIPDMVNLAFMAESGGETFTEILAPEGGRGGFSLFQDGSYLIELDRALPLSTAQKFLQLENGFNHPEETSLRLLDGSRVVELRIPERQTIPEIFRDQSWEIIRLTTDTGEFFAGISQELQRTFFTNSPDVLIAKTRTTNKTAYFFIDTLPFFQFLLTNSKSLSTVIPFIDSEFVHVGIDKRLFGSKIVLYSSKTVDKQ